MKEQQREGGSDGLCWQSESGIEEEEEEAHLPKLGHDTTERSAESLLLQRWLTTQSLAACCSLRH